MQCEKCGNKLTVFEFAFLGVCDQCNKNNFQGIKTELGRASSKRLAGPEDVGGSPKDYPGRRISKNEKSWIELLLTVAWIVCFGSSALFFFLAIVAASDLYDQDLTVLLIVCAISSAVSGIIFAAIGKIISSLTSINDNLRLLVTQNEVRVVLREEGAESATDKVS